MPRRRPPRKLAEHVRAIMHYAIGQDLIEVDPTIKARIGLGRQRAKVKHFGALPWSEAPAAYEYVMGSRSYIGKRLAAALLMLTATRTSEVRGARWDEVDMDSRLWVIPAVRMKAGIEHVVPLSKQAIAVLRKAGGSGPGLIFQDRNGKGLSQDGIRQLLKRRFPSATAHGSRSSFRDWVSDATEYPAEVAEHALAHLEGSETRRAYARSNYLDKRRVMMQAWADFIAP